VLVLEEVARGWMIDEQHDVLSVWHSASRCSTCFLPTIGDLYGNADPLALPDDGRERVPYAPGPTMRNQPRGALFVRIGRPPHRRHASRSHQRPERSCDRIRCARSLREVANETAVVVAGDLNAEPGDIEICLFDQARLPRTSDKTGGPTTTATSREAHRLRWGLGVVGAQAHTTPETTSRPTIAAWCCEHHAHRPMSKRPAEGARQLD